MFESRDNQPYRIVPQQQRRSSDRARRLVSGLLLAVLAAISLTSRPSSFSPVPTAQAVQQTADQIIPDRYIVVFKETAFTNGVTASGETTTQLAERMVSAASGQLHFTYEQALKGFAATLSPEAVRTLGANPIVDYIEPDRIVELDDVQSPVPSWGLSRIDQRSGPPDNRYRHDLSGEKAHVYIIDSGIRASHRDFDKEEPNKPIVKRIGNGYSAVPGLNPNEDCIGHGTHVAGIAAGTSYGVAKKATIHSVRVFGCVPTTPASVVIAGVNWVTVNRLHPAVVNMSLGGLPSQALDSAVQRLITFGVTVVVAAGNANKNACDYSPARVPAAITAGSSSFWYVDVRSPFSNYGPCVDIFAPGHSINSTSNTGDNDSTIKSGTSMAAPHVTGWVAMYLDVFDKATPAAIQAALIEHSTKNVLWDIGAGSPNRLLYVPNVDDQACKVESSVAAASSGEYTSERRSDFAQLYRLRDEVFSTSDFGQRLIKIHKDHSFEAAKVLLTNVYLRTQLMDLLASSREAADSLVDGDGQAQLTRDLIMKIEAYLTGVAQHSSPKMRDDLLRAWRDADLWSYEGKPVREVLESRSERRQSDR